MNTNNPTSCLKVQAHKLTTMFNNPLNHFIYLKTCCFSLHRLYSKLHLLSHSAQYSYKT